MNQEKDNKNHNSETITKLINVIIVLILIVVFLSVLLFRYVPVFTAEKEIEPTLILPDSNGNFTEAGKLQALQHSDTTQYWQAPEESTLLASEKELVLYGKELIGHTSTYYGENGTLFKSSTNGLNCQNCHLEAGTKVFGINFSAVASHYPKYRARSGSVETIYKRVNDCFERSLNGKAIDTLSKEMQAIKAYVKWLGKDVTKGKKPAGSGFKDITYLDRAANVDEGRKVYTEKCQSCHQPDGTGKMNSDKIEFTYPPLWGNQSYNVGAGLYRLSNFAKFVKYNMPQGVSHNKTQLSSEEAWDVAAFVNSQPHPKKDVSKDWPKLNEKPFDNPFGPYADGFDETQHKYGPFKIIIDKLATLNNVKK